MERTVSLFFEKETTERGKSTHLFLRKGLTFLMKEPKIPNIPIFSGNSS